MNTLSFPSKYPCDGPTNGAFSPNVYWAPNMTRTCDCSSGWQVCPDDAAGPTTSNRLIPTTDYLYNMTGRDLPNWILKTNKKYEKRRYLLIFTYSITMCILVE